MLTQTEVVNLYLKKVPPAKSRRSQSMVTSFLGCSIEQDEEQEQDEEEDKERTIFIPYLQTHVF